MTQDNQNEPSAQGVAIFDETSTAKALVKEREDWQAEHPKPWYLQNQRPHKAEDKKGGLK